MVDGISEGSVVSTSEGPGTEKDFIDVQDFSDAELILIGSTNSAEYRAMPHTEGGENPFPMWAVYNNKVVSTTVKQGIIHGLKERQKVVYVLRKPYILNGELMNWSHIILEAYCGRKWSLKKDKYFYQWPDAKKRPTNGKDFIKVKNESYDKDYKTPRKPKFCKNVPCYLCLEKGCKFLAYSNGSLKDYKILFKRCKTG